MADKNVEDGGGDNHQQDEDNVHSSSSLTRLAGLSLRSRLEDSSYLRTIPEDRDGGDDADSNVAEIRLGDALRQSRQQQEYPSSVLSDAASSTRAMVFDDEEDLDAALAAAAGRAPAGAGAGATVESSEVASSAAHGAESTQGVLAASHRRFGGGVMRQEEQSSSLRRRRTASLLVAVALPVRCCSIDLKSRKTRWIICLSIGLTIGIVISIGLVANFLTVPDSIILSSTSPPSPSPAPSPGFVDSSYTLQPSGGVSIKTASELDQVIMTVSYPDTFEDPFTPQSQARAWMLESDLLLEDVLQEGEERTAQRYACAEFIYALVGDAESSTRKRQRQLQPDISIIDNNNVTVIIDDEEDDFEDYNNVSYYLLPDEEECDWPGFECDDGMVGHKITKINLTNHDLRGSIPQEIKNLTFLQELTLNRNKLVGDLPDAWFQKYDDGDTTTDDVGEMIRPLQHLYWLDLSDNKLSGAINPGLWDLPVLRFLYLHKNFFYDSIDQPDDDQYKESILQDVWLDNNDLMGTFPSWLLTDLKFLESFTIGMNRLDGPLPDLQWPANLTDLDISGNQFTGKLPASILTSTPRLHSFYAEGNLLSGSLPNTTPTVTNVVSEDPYTSRLQNVFLHDNRFTGRLPDNFGANWNDLEKLTVQINTVTGSLGPPPTQNCSTWWPKIQLLEADCQVQCLCCTDCFR